MLDGYDSPCSLCQRHRLVPGLSAAKDCNRSISEAFTNLVKNLKSQRPSIFTK